MYEYSAVVAGTSKGNVIAFDSTGEVLQRSKLSDNSIDVLCVGSLLSMAGGFGGEVKCWKSPVLAEVRGGWIDLFTENAGSVGLDGAVTSLFTGGVEGVATTSAGSIF